MTLQHASAVHVCYKFITFQLICPLLSPPPESTGMCRICLQYSPENRSRRECPCSPLCLAILLHSHLSPASFPRPQQCQVLCSPGGSEMCKPLSEGGWSGQPHPRWEHLKSHSTNTVLSVLPGPHYVSPEGGYSSVAGTRCNHWCHPELRLASIWSLLFPVLGFQWHSGETRKFPLAPNIYCYTLCRFFTTLGHPLGLPRHIAPCPPWRCSSGADTLFRPSSCFFHKYF